MTFSLRGAFARRLKLEAAAVAAIHAAGLAVSLMLTQPDRPSGRDMKLAGGRVKRFFASA